MSPPSPKKIAILINPDNPYREKLLKGLGDFVREGAKWDLYGIDQPCYHPIPSPSLWEADGCIIFDKPLRKTAKTLIKNCLFKASVNRISEEISSITCDLKTGIQLSLKHLAEQGCRQIIMFGIKQHSLIELIQGLADSLTLNLTNLPIESIPALTRTSSKPLGVIVPDCLHALEINRLTKKHQLVLLPLISLGDDHNCRLSEAAISSLSYPARDLGYRAAQLLAQQFKQPNRIQHLTFPATKLNIRSSSQLNKVDDFLIQDALAHIRLTITHSPLSVAELAKFLGISRTSLTERFQSKLGLPPADLIRLERLVIAKRRLRRSNQMVKSVALSMGFSSCQNFARFFKKATQQTPSEFVKSHRNGQIEPHPRKL